MVGGDDQHRVKPVFPLWAAIDTNTMQAEKENIALGGPKFYSPGTCPADFKFLHYGVHILGKNP
jgi:hypothetical protein